MWVHDVVGTALLCLFVLWIGRWLCDVVQFRRLGFARIMIVLTHILLAGTGFLIACLGYAGKIAAGKDTILSAFGLLAPDRNPQAVVWIYTQHKALIPYLIIIIALHVCATVFHALVLRDRTLARMLW